MGQGIVMNEIIQPIAANLLRLVSNKTHRCELLICSEQTKILVIFLARILLYNWLGRKEEEAWFKIFINLN